MRNIGISLLAAAALALPASAKTAKKAEVTCNDGTTSTAGRGACSHHGGVADAKATDKATKSAEKAEKSADKAAKSSKNKTRAELDEGKKETEKKSGGILDTIFGRKKADTAQGRSSTTTPRSSTRDAKSGTPTAKCKDGTMSYSAHHSGTCSGHGGVDQWLDNK
jgi:Spy/CpxP family protein refolding chaperone